MSNESIEQRILSLYNEEKWQDILNLSCAVSNTEECRFFWVLPIIDDLQWMCKTIKKYDLSGLVSIGCGSGLLEWLFQQYCGLNVLGVELDQSWWCSKYAPPIFLKNIIFIQEEASLSFSVSEKDSLLFCYFNNAEAFRSYLKNYRGHLVFVIGPAEGTERTTDPLPLDTKFGEYGWELHGKRQIGCSKDVIAAYTKNCSTFLERNK